MQYKPYPKRADTKSRMARKHARSSVFLANSKIAKAQRKAARMARKVAEE